VLFRSPVSTINNILNFNQFSNISKKTLEDYGNMKIINMAVGKTPLHLILTSTLNLATVGELSRLAKQEGYDNLYHTFLILDMENNIKIIVEKNEVINIAVFNPSSLSQKTELKNIGIHQTIILNDLINNTQNRMKGSFFTYDPFYNNCQNFVKNILLSNNLWTQEIDNFFYQDVSNIKKNLNPIIPKIMRKITDFGAITSRILGRGIKNKKKCICDFKNYIASNNLQNETNIENLKEHFLDYINSDGFKYL